MKNISGIFLLFLVFNCTSNPHLKTYTAEISALKTESDKEQYWKKLHHLDQTVYLKETKGAMAGDSISLTNMMRTALMFEIHGDEVYKLHNLVPILNFTHNYIGDSNLAFWPIILKCKNVGGSIDQFGGGFPAYQLEGMSMSFYDYSLSGKDSEFPRLLKKLEDKVYPKVSIELAKIYEEQFALSSLKEKKIIGQWNRQPAKNFEDGGPFEFVNMSDGNLYIRHRHRLQKLIEISKTDTITTYKIKNEPFDWTYQLSNHTLRLVDDLNTTLITYNTFKK
ncbi:hypothetical protein [Psychroserpens sp. SPM9]|uniref:hypothetical protein n=1 Tax=Psychroserpens sp. SPM9 TaxID=2975598 RepID=UPI0021A4BBCB|nr:hypothetical protein [Psychroserpens sp. SPM9]MDG5492508.1 hypothetical protein [Psychroserpens sp. SPM9]